MELYDLPLELATILVNSKDIPETIYKINNVYNVSFIYECLEAFEFKAEKLEIARKQELHEIEQEKAKKDRK